MGITSKDARRLGEEEEGWFFRIGAQFGMDVARDVRRECSSSSATLREKCDCMARAYARLQAQRDTNGG